MESDYRHLLQDLLWVSILDPLMMMMKVLVRLGSIQTETNRHKFAFHQLTPSFLFSEPLIQMLSY
jgi:hypothetical protein